MQFFFDDSTFFMVKWRCILMMSSQFSRASPGAAVGHGVRVGAVERGGAANEEKKRNKMSVFGSRYAPDSGCRSAAAARFGT